LFPQIARKALDKKDRLPACSAAESLIRQEPFLNQTIAQHALAMLPRLSRHGEITHHGAFINLASGRVTALAVDLANWARLRKSAEKNGSRSAPNIS
jgi:hypothetical protein